MSNATDDLQEPSFSGSWNKQTAWDFLFVVVLPTACLVLDPGVLKSGFISSFAGQVLFSELQFPAYFLIVLLMVGFWASYLPMPSPAAAGLLRGVMLLGLAVSAVLAIPLVPLAIGTLVSSLAEGGSTLAVLAPFGLVPAFTAYRYHRRLRVVGRHPSDRRTVSVPVVAGFVIPIALASILHIGIAKTLEASIKELYSSEPGIAVAAMERLAEHPLCNTACRARIVKLFCAGEIDLPPERFVPLFEEDSGGVALEPGGCYFD